MYMENVWLKRTKASFTVEAVFIMTISIWVTASICYLSVYSHDRTALYSLAQNYLEQSVENGKNFTESEVRSGLKKYLEEHMLLFRIDGVSVKKGALSIQSEIRFHIEARLPFAARLLSSDSERRSSISHEVLFAPCYMWDCEILYGRGKDGD